MEKPTAFFGARRRRTRRFLAGRVSRLEARKATLHKRRVYRSHEDKFRENRSLRCNIVPEIAYQCELMEHWDTSTQFISKAGRLVTLNTEGDLLLDDQNFESLKNTLGSCESDRLILVKKSIRQHNTCSPSQFLCCEIPLSAPGGNIFIQVNEKSSGRLNERFLDCEFNVNPGITSEQLLAKIKHHVLSIVDDYDQDTVTQKGGWNIQVTKSYPVVSSQNRQTTRTRNYCTGCFQDRFGLSCQCVLFEFESMYCLDIVIHSPRNNKISVWITDCLSNQFFCRQFFCGTLKADEEMYTSLSTSSSAHIFLFALGELHASCWRKLHAN